MYTIKVPIEDMTTLLAALNHYVLDLKNDPIRKQAAKLNLNVSEQVLEQTEPILAFDRAIKDGVLSNDINADNYAGRYMYMGTSKDGPSFKHRMTRQYLHVKHA